MSTYNGTDYVVEQLESIRLQKKVIVNILIRDDGSKDETLDVLKEYQTRNPALILEIIAGKNLGSTSSFSELVKYAYVKYSSIFDYYSLADQDDFWLEKKLTKASMELDKLDNSLANTYCSDTKVVDSNLNSLDGIRPRKVQMTKGRALVRNIATGCTMVFNKRALELYATKSPEFIKIHDHALFLICSFMGNVVYDPNSYILYRQHGNNQIGGSDSVSNRFKDRLKHKGDLKKHYIENVAKSFLVAFHDDLSDEDKVLIRKVSDYRKSLLNRVRLLFSRGIAKEEFEDNMFFKIKVLLGGI